MTYEIAPFRYRLSISPLIQLFYLLHNTISATHLGILAKEIFPRQMYAVIMSLQTYCG